MLKPLLFVLALCLAFTASATTFIDGGWACPGCTCWVTMPSNPEVLTCVESGGGALHRCVGNPPVMCVAFKICGGSCDWWNQ